MIIENGHDEFGLSEGERAAKQVAPLCNLVLYALVAAGGLVGTWWFNAVSIAAGESYLRAWFDSAASSSAAVDVLATALAACVFFIAEGRRLGMRNVWVLLPLTFVAALAFTFPLFLAWRELTMRRQAAAMRMGRRS